MRALSLAQESRSMQPNASALQSNCGMASTATSWTLSMQKTPMAPAPLADPVAIVLHELGHFGAFVAFGFPDPVLRYASVSWAHSGEWVTHFRAETLRRRRRSLNRGRWRSPWPGGLR